MNWQADDIKGILNGAKDFADTVEKERQKRVNGLLKKFENSLELVQQDDQIPVGIPTPPYMPVRREGLLGRLSQKDLSYLECLLDTYKEAVRLGYSARVLAILMRAIRQIIVQAIQDMEGADQRLRPGSFAKLYSTAMMQIGAEAMVQFYTDAALGFNQQVSQKRFR